MAQSAPAKLLHQWWEALSRQSRERTVLTVVLIYLAAGLTWVLLTDALILDVGATPERLTRIQSLKEVVFVTATGILFYTLLLRTLKGQRLIGPRPRTEGDPRSWMETASDAIFVADREGRCLDVNARACEMLGYTAGELLRMRMRDLVQREDLASAPLRIEDLLAGKAVRVERRLKRKDGTLVAVETSATMLRDGRLLAIVRDVTERKQTHEALRRSEERFRAFVEQSTEGIWCIELGEPLSTTVAEEDQVEHFFHHGYISECNLAMARMHGFDSPEGLRGAPLVKILAPTNPRNRDYLGTFVRARYRLAEAEFHESDRPGTPRHFMSNLVGVVQDGLLRRAWGIQRDVTERRRLEDRLRQAQRMEAMGRLAGGVAHDFNNLLTAVLGYTDMARKRVEKDVPVLALLDEITRAGDRATELTRQLLAFSRKQVVEPRVLDLGGVVADLESLLARVVGERVEVVLRLDPGAGRIRADASQVEQVILNLAVNARDAMPEGGRVVIETARARVDEDAAGGHLDVRPGHYVRLAVTDTGCGMSPSVREQMFEPFFTTKEEGTGLGLATVYGIVKQSGGHITVESEPGRGARFEVFFPRVDQPLDPARPPVPESEVRGGDETVLHVEDDDVVRELVERVLGSRGYKVVRARQGEEALALLQASTGPVHLLLTDMVLPGMSGSQLAERVAAVRPGLKVLFVSGYLDDGTSAERLLAADAAFLPKPFTPDVLLRKVREVLESPGP